MDDKQLISLGESTPNYRVPQEHTASSIQADTLFNFTTKLSYVLDAIQMQRLAPRYCAENVEYLGLSGIKALTFPMRCFCDINLHRLKEHLSWYGHYGLAFSKEWGMKRGVQPVQYINPASDLCKSFAMAFNESIKTINTPGNTPGLQIIKSFLLHELAFYKPYDGLMHNRVTGEDRIKCYTDECEWRFVPDLSGTGYKQVYSQEDAMRYDLTAFSDSMAEQKDICLPFALTEIKYIIVKEAADLRLLVNCIDGLGLDSLIKYELISKTIVWDNSEGDF